MTRSYTAAHRIGKLFLVVLAGSTLVCAPQQGIHQPRPSPNNPLPADVEPTSDAFRQKLSGVRPGGANTRRRDAACWLCRDIEVTIEALGDTYLVDPDKAPIPGIAVAHLVNHHDSKTEKYYGLKPKKDAEYYLWVDTIPGSRKAQWTLLEVPIADGPVLAAKPTPLGKCHARSAGETPRSEADFAEYRPDCDKLVAGKTRSMTGASMLPLAHLAGLIDAAKAAVAASSGGWIDCSYGCCT